MLTVVIAASEGGGVQEEDPGCVRHQAAAEVQHHHQGETQGGLQTEDQDSVLSGFQVKEPSYSLTVGYFSFQNCS